MGFSKKKRSLAAKIRYLFAFLMTPIVFLLITTLSSYQKEVDFAEKERDGNNFLQPVISFMEVVARRGLLVERLRRQVAPQSDLERLDAKGDAAFAELEKVYKELGPDLQFTDAGLSHRKREHVSLKNLSRKWYELRHSSASDGSPTESSKKHQDVITLLRGMITYAGDSSNLVLDPDLDSYYLMDLVVMALPQNQDRVQRIQAHIENLEAKQPLTLQNHLLLNTFGAFLQEVDLRKISSDVDSLINEDNNFYGSHENVQNEMRSRMHTYDEGILPFLEVIKGVGISGKIDLGRLEVARVGDAALSSSFSLWHFSSRLLNDLLEVRIKEYKRRQLGATILSLLLVLIFWFMFFIVVRSMNAVFSDVYLRLLNQTEVLGDVICRGEGSAKSLSNSTTAQAAAIEETIASMEQMAAMLGQTTLNASAAKNVVEQGLEEANSRREAVAHMSAAMTEIRSSNEKLEGLVKMMGEIDSKTKVINDIVFETRLLSFNASIEAARAGPHGRGFAVVAEEIGKLATMSGRAADEIRKLLETSNREVVAIVNAIQERANTGADASTDCALVFVAMGKTLERIGEAVANIAAAAQEQEQGVKQTNIAMVGLGSITNQNSASADSLAEHAQNLETCARHMATATASLKDFVFGGVGDGLDFISESPASAGDVAADATIEEEAEAYTAESAHLGASIDETSPNRSDSRWRAA